MRNYTKKGTNAENFMQISLLLKKIWYLKDSRNGHFAMHYSSFMCDCRGGHKSVDNQTLGRLSLLTD